MLFPPIIVFDLETTSNRPSDTEICQIAAMAINSRNLTPIRGAEFNSLMRPLHPDRIQDGALAVNKKTREQLAEAPHPQEVWHSFAKWAAQFNYKGKTDAWSAPIAAGHNILNFDLPIYARYCREYGTVRTEKNGEVVPAIFSNFIRYDTMQLLGAWTESIPQPAKLGMDFLRKFMDFPAERLTAGHDALEDVRDTAAILIKILSVMRYMAPRVHWEGCMNPDKVAARQAAREAKQKVDDEGKRGGGGRRKAS